MEAKCTSNKGCDAERRAVLADIIQAKASCLSFPQAEMRMRKLIRLDQALPALRAVYLSPYNQYKKFDARDTWIVAER